MMNILLDLKCLELGLPPLSGNANSAAKMIFDLSSVPRRKISRKIRKIAKSEINLRCEEIACKLRKANLRASLEKRAGLKNCNFSKTVLKARIDLARSNVLRSIRK